MEVLSKKWVFLQLWWHTWLAKIGSQWFPNIRKDPPHISDEVSLQKSGILAETKYGGFPSHTVSAATLREAEDTTGWGRNPA